MDISVSRKEVHTVRAAIVRQGSTSINDSTKVGEETVLALPSFEYACDVSIQASTEASCAADSTKADAADGFTTAAALPWYQEDYAPHDLAERRAPFTLEMQAALRKHQFPDECAGKRFAVLENSPWAGIGSLVHTATVALAWAYNNGYILIYETDFGSSVAHGEYCQDHRNLECFFSPLSSCAPNAGSVVVTVTQLDGHNRREELPRGWRDRLLDSGYDRDPLHWWRAQGAAFVMRLNARTASWLQAKRQAAVTAGYMPAIMPADTISIHVRHGDKHREMTLRSWREHLAEAKRLVADRQLKNPVIFLSTEDPEVIKEAQQFKEWQILYVIWDRRNEDFMQTVHAGVSDMP